MSVQKEKNRCKTSGFLVGRQLPMAIATRNNLLIADRLMFLGHIENACRLEVNEFLCKFY